MKSDRMRTHFSGCRITVFANDGKLGRAPGDALSASVAGLTRLEIGIRGDKAQFEHISSDEFFSGITGNGFRRTVAFDNVARRT